MNLTVSARPGSWSVFCEFVLKINLPVLHINRPSPTDNDLIVGLTVANIPSNVISGVLN